jgi:hypothetical protein
LAAGAGRTQIAGLVIAREPDSVAEPVELVATLLSDLPLDPSRFRGLLLDISRSSLAGAISPQGLTAIHSFGDAEYDRDVRDIRIRARAANTAPRAALVELKNQGFVPASAVQVETWGDQASRIDAWMLTSLYAEQLQGWILTNYLDFDQAADRLGDEVGLAHVSLGGKHRSVLISASSLRTLAG